MSIIPSELDSEEDISTKREKMRERERGGTESCDVWDKYKARRERWKAKVRER